MHAQKRDPAPKLMITIKQNKEGRQRQGNNNSSFSENTFQYNQFAKRTMKIKVIKAASQ